MRRRRLTLSSTSGQIRRTAAASRCPTGVCTRSPGTGAVSVAGSARSGRACAGLDCAGRDSAGRDSAGRDSAGRSAGRSAFAGRSPVRRAGRRSASSAGRDSAWPARRGGPSRPRAGRRPAPAVLRPGGGIRRPPAAARRLGRRRLHRVAGRGEPALHPLQALQQRAPVGRRRRQQHPRRHQLEQQPRRRRPAHLDQPGVHDVRHPGQRRRPEPRRLVGHPLDLVGRAVDEALGVRVRHRVEHDQVAQPLQQVGREPARVVPGLDHAIDRLVHRRRVTGRQRVHHLVQQRAVGDAEQPDRVRVRHAAPARTRR